MMNLGFTNLMAVVLALQLGEHARLRSLSFRCLLGCHALSISTTRRPRPWIHNIQRYNRICDHGFIQWSRAFCSNRGFSLRSVDNAIDEGEHSADTDTESLDVILRSAYNSGETDGVQDIITSRSILALLLSNNKFASIENVSSHLIETAIQASTIDNQLNRGVLSGMLNAILASCCTEETLDDALRTKYSELAWRILEQMDEMYENDDSTMVSPDLVTLSVVYYSHYLIQHGSGNSSSDALVIQSKILERAQKLAKKSAGSARRKALAAEKRRKSSSRSDNLSADLQSLYGPDISVLHEDDDLMVISKPAGMVCYHNKKTSAGKLTTSRKKKSKDGGKKDSSYGTKELDISLEDALLDMPVPLSTLNPVARGIVHRLDRGTSGTIVMAKNDDAHLRLVALFFLRRVKKTYMALVPARSFGSDIDLASEGVIDSPVDRRPAVSKYKILSTYCDQTQSTQTCREPTAMLLEVDTFTGRKHQVRVHCANGLGRPIFLDPLYSNILSPQEKRKQFVKNKSSAGDNVSSDDTETIPDAILQAAGEKERFFLHACTIKIPELNINVESPLPSWWNNIIMQWDKK